MRCLLVLVSCAVAFAQTLDQQVRALRPQDSKELREAVLDDLEQRARVSLERITHATNKTEAARIRGTIRPKLEESLGFRRLPWPPDGPALLTGTIVRKGYRIEKLVFQTLPGVFVAAHMYLPEPVKPVKPIPAILFYNGHWWPDSKMRPDFQSFCINMARWGVAVLSFDPFGQGERGVSSRDHRRTETLLGGVSQQGIAEYETRCLLQYLLARKDIDRTRIGMTGASGGGYNTWITAALDDRIKVAVPVVGTSDFFEQIHVTRPLDWYRAAEHCHFVPGLITYANNHELLAAVYPRPLMIISAAVDQSFPAGGVRAVYEYGRRLYQSSGDGARIGHFEDAVEGHGYQKAKREAAYGWFLRWLLDQGDGTRVAEPPTQAEPFDALELSSFGGGEKKAAGPGIVNAAKRLIEKPAPALSPAAWQRRLGAPLPAGKLTLSLQPRQVQRVLFETQPGVSVPAVVIRPGPEGTAPEAGVLVAIDDRGKEELAADPVVMEALRRNWMVWAIDPRGFGELAVERGWVFAVSLLLDENFVWRQGSDIQRIAEAGARLPSHRVALYARGHNASLAATYAAAISAWRPSWMVLREGFLTFRQFVDRPQSLPASFRLVNDDVREQRRSAFDREIPSEYVPFHGLLSFDLPLLMAGRNVTVIDPINGDWTAMPSTAARGVLPSSVRVSTVADFVSSTWP